MGDMPNWHRFVDSVLSGRQQDKPDKTDKREKAEKGNLHANFLDTKKAGE